MSSKSELIGQEVSPVDRSRPRSLRLRLVLWYGILLAGALVFFAFLVWELTTNALNQGLDSSLRAETRVVNITLGQELSTTSPYWPTRVSLQAINAYQEPGTVFEIIDSQGQRRYDSDQNVQTAIPVSTETTSAVRAGQTVWYSETISGERVRVEASPIRVPSSSSASGQDGSTGPVIGTLLVARSLNDVDSTLLLLRTLLIFAGLGTIAGGLLGGWVIARRVLYPLAEMVKTIRSITAMTAHGTRVGGLSQRVPSPGGRDEMAQVVDTFNTMLTDLENAARTQRRFVADASHELRAPLTTIQGNLAFLQRHVDELPADERRVMLADAHGETLRLAQLVEELLLLARADASVDTPLSVSGDTADTEGIKTREQPRPIELDHTVLQLVRQFRGRLSGEDTKVNLEVGHIEPVRVNGDEERIRRVLLILLDNALKYTSLDEQGQAGRVVVSLEKIGAEACVRVRDTGIGIDADDLPHIFERFYRADRARSRQGTGLGLAIAQTVMEQLGGRISVESTPGKGSIFSIWLPLTQ
jgi:two-component system OmpR family sensor kinase